MDVYNKPPMNVRDFMPTECGDALKLEVLELIKIDYL